MILPWFSATGFLPLFFSPRVFRVSAGFHLTHGVPSVPPPPPPPAFCFFGGGGFGVSGGVPLNPLVIF